MFCAYTCAVPIGGAGSIVVSAGSVVVIFAFPGCSRRRLINENAMFGAYTCAGDGAGSINENATFGA